MESHGTSTLRAGGRRFVSLHRLEVGAVSSLRKAANYKRCDVECTHEGTARVSPLSGKRDRRPTQEHSLRGAGRLRDRNDERRPVGHGKDGLSKRLLGRGSGAEFKSKREDRCF